MHAFATGFVARGHEVEVICEAPSHPAGVIPPEYRRPLTRRRAERLRVSYVWVSASPIKTAPRRILNYGSYATMASLVGALSRRADVVLATSPPLSVGVVGGLLSARHGAPWVLDVRDLWPDIAVEMGELRGDRVIRAVESIEHRLYRGAGAIVTTTEPIKRKIERRGGVGKVSVIANGTTAVWLDVASTDPDRAALDLPHDRFVWTYAGNLGSAQGLDTAIEAAARLGDEFHLVVVGDGPVRSRLFSEAARLAPERVEFRQPLPAAQAARLMRASDALLVPLADWPVLRDFVPSKLFDCCAVGRPVILAATGESRRLAEEARAALSIPPEDPDELAAAVRRLRGDLSLTKELTERGILFAAEHDRARGADRMVDLVDQVARSGIARPSR
jgi:colanic acid biosynthesis glycosyl transferase WcaI